MKSKSEIFSGQIIEDEKEISLCKLFQLEIETVFYNENFDEKSPNLFTYEICDSYVQYIGELFNLAQMHR